METPTSVARPQTLRQAKAEYRRHGPRVSLQEQRRLARSAELLRRADAIKEAERRRKQNASKKREREDRVRNERQRLNIKSPEPYLSPRQTRMGTFFKCSKPYARGNIKEDKRFSRKEHTNGDISEVETEPATDTEEEQEQGRGLEVPRHTNCGEIKYNSFSSFNEDMIAALEEQTTALATCQSDGLEKSEVRHETQSVNTDLNLCPLQTAVSCDPQDEFKIFICTQDIVLTSDDLLELEPSKRGIKTTLDEAPKTQNSEEFIIETRPNSSSFQHIFDPEPTDLISRGGTTTLPPSSTRAHGALTTFTSDLEPWEFELSTQDFNNTIFEKVA